MRIGFGLVATYLSRPVVLRIASPGPQASDQYVVDSQVTGNFLFAYGVTDRLQLDFALPVTFIQTGAGTSPLTGGADLRDTAIRDLRFGFAYTLVPHERISPDAAGIWAMATGRPKAADVATLPFPGIATDYLPMLTALMTIADGVSFATENLYQGRFRYVGELTRMGANIGVDTLLGMIPFVGAIPDFFFRSNTRNLKIIKRHLDRHHPSTMTIDGLSRSGR